MTDREREALAFLGAKSDLTPLAQVEKVLAATPRNDDVGLRAREAAVELGLIPQFVHDAIPTLRQWMATNSVCLDSAQLFYNGHLTHAMISLPYVLNALGMPRLRVTAGRYSGDITAKAILESMLPRPRSALELRAGGNRDRLVSVGDKSEGFRRELDVARAAGRTLLAAKSGYLASRGAWSREETRGDIRFLSHNAHDATALRRFRRRRYITSVRGSLFKLLEARFVGEATALAASRIVREKWGLPIRDTKVYVLGYGTIGRSLTRAMRRFGLSSDSIVVVEPDLARRRQASAVCTALPSLPESSDPRAVIFNTASETALHAGNVTLAAEHALAFNLASSGLGVDVESILDAADSRKEVGRASYHPFVRVDPDTDAILPSTRDARCTFKRPGGVVRSVELINVADGRREEPAMHALNLSEAPWPDRFACTTAMAVIMGVLGAMAQRAPGIVPTPRDLERRLMRQLLATGIRDLRPLDPPKTVFYGEAKHNSVWGDLFAFRSSD